MMNTLTQNGQNGQNAHLESRLTVTFKGYGSAEFEMSYENVTPLQILAMCEWFKWHAAQKLNEQIKQADDKL